MKLSIITINYNNKPGLERTIRSAVDQSFPDIEYIVIDGGSTDGSKDIIQQYSNKISYWVSEPDKGIYNAMNKGIARATGDYLLFINSGDELYSKTVLAQFLEKPLSADIVYGDILFVSKDSEVRSVYPEKLTFQFFRNNALGHPATFIKKAWFSNLDGYDEQLKIASDWKFTLLAVCKHNCSYEYRKILVSRFFDDGISSDPRNREKVARERHAVLEADFAAYLDDYDQLETLTYKWHRLSYINPVRLAKRIFKTFSRK